MQLRETFAEASSVELIDGECADATLRATRATNEKVARATSCIGKGSVEDLDELPVASGARWNGSFQFSANFKNGKLLARINTIGFCGVRKLARIRA